MEESLLTIYLLCRNRLKYAEIAIDSILKQNNKNFKLIISDNSTDNKLKNLIEDKYKNLNYISWFPGITQVQHMNTILEMTKSQYFMMFHDDDVMEVDYINNILELINLEPNAVAIGTNSILINENGKKIAKNEIGNSYNFKSKNKIEKIERKSDLIRKYLSGDAGGIAPFSTYVYNKKLIENIRFDYLKGRNYFDTIFLTEILNKGHIIWINKPLVQVRTRHENVSSSCGLDYKYFLSYIKNIEKLNLNQENIEEYRLLRLYTTIKKREKKFTKPVILYILLVAPKLLFKSNSFRKRILRKINNEIMNKVRKIKGF